MRYELKAVNYRDRLMIPLRAVGVVVGFAAVLVAVYLLAGETDIAEESLWIFAAFICAKVAFEAYRARGPDHAGYVEMTGTTLTHRLNEYVDVIDLSTVSKAVCFDYLGNKTIVLRVGAEWKEIVYSAYSDDLIFQFCRAFGERLKEGWYEWVKSWYDN